MKNLFLFACLLIFLGTSFAQNLSNTFAITGKIIEKATDAPMGYCTVSLFGENSTELITGNISNFDGEFTIDVPKYGNYTLEISFIGFQTKRIENIVVSKENKQVNIGDIFLKADAEQIKEVEVTAIRNTVKYEIDKKVVNVDKQLAAGNGNAVDVLATVPSVQIDIEGNVQLRGKTSFTVLINGRPSVLSAQEALQQIPASNIENIEIITNPSARYDAEGSAGIINIILKSDREKGFSGSITARYGMFQNYGGDLILSYTKKKFTYTVSGNLNQSSNPRFVNSTAINTLSGIDYTTASDGESNRIFNNARLEGNVEYRINKKNTLTAQGKYGTWGMFVDGDEVFTLSDNVNNFDSIYNNINDTERGSNYYEFQATYDTKISEKSNLSMHASYNKRQFEEEVLNFQEREEVVFAGTKSTEIGPSYRLRVNVDYLYQVNDSSKFELGFLQEMRGTDEVSENFDYNSVSNEYEELNGFKQTIDYNINVRAFYGNFSTKYQKLGFQVGLRTELTDRTVAIEESDDSFSIKRLDLFPSIYFSYELGQGNQLFLNYSKRIERPREWFLEPNPIFLNANTVWQGNPDILPVYTHSFEFGWLRTFEKNGSFNAQVYYQFDQNNFEVVNSPFSENVRLRMPMNVGVLHFVGVEQNLNFKIFKWWDVDIATDIAFRKVIGSINDFEIDRQAILGNFRVNNYFLVTSSTKVQFDGNYRTPRVNTQGRTEGNYAFNLGIRQDFLNKSLTLSVQARDLFNTSIRERTTDLPNFFFNEINDARAPVLIFSIAYSINNYKKKRSRYDDAGGDDG